MKTIFAFILLFAGQVLMAQSINWSYNVGSSIRPQSPAVADDGTIYIGSEDNTNFHAINPDGTLKWVYDQLPDNVYSSASIGVDGTIYVGSKDDYIHAINPSDGSQKWVVQLPDFTNIIYSTPAIAKDETIYIGSDDDNFYAFNPDGSQKWEFAGGGNFRGSPAIGSDGTVYITNDDNNLYAIDPATGIKKWEFDVGGIAQSGLALQADGTIIVGVDQGGSTGAVFALNPDGTQKWGITVVGRITVCAPALAEDGTIYIGTKEGNNLLALDPTDGSQIWEYVTSDIINSSPAVGDDGKIYFGSFDNHLYCLNPDGTLNFKVNLNDRIWSSPAITSNGDLIVGSYDGKVYSIDIPSNGLADSNWPMFGKNTKHTSSDDKINWAYDVGSSIRPQSPAVADDGTIYIGSEDNTNFHAINPDGTLKWVYDQLPDNVYSSASIGVDGTIYVGSKDDYIHAINPSDGSQKWVVQLPDFTNIIYSTPAIANDGTIYIGSDDDNFYAFNPDGSQKWVFATSGFNVRSTPSIGSDGTVYFASDDNKVYALNPSDGSEVWSTNVGGDVEGCVVLDSDGTIFVGVDKSSTTGSVVALHPDDGSIKWESSNTGRVLSSPAINNGVIYFGAKDTNKLYALDIANGNELWSYTTGDIINSSPAIGEDGKIYFGSFDNHLYCLNPDGTLNFKVNLNDRIWSSPAITSGGDLIVGSYDGKLYSIDIPSSGLANSNWPMFGKNTKHTSSNDTGNRFITYNQLDGYVPFDPSGLNIDFGILTVEDGKAIISSPTLLENVIVKPEAVLNLNADLTSDIYFESNSSGSGQLDDANGVTITGSVSVERYIPARRAFRFLSSAISGQSIANAWQQNTHITGSGAAMNGFDPSGSNNPSMFTFDATTQTWQPVTTTATSLEPGDAYRILIRGDRTIDLLDPNANSQPPTPTTLVASGDVAIGSLTTGVQLPSLATGINEFSLVGNPYQAVVNANNLTYSGGVRSDFIAYWDPNLSTKGAYVVVELSTGDAFDDSIPPSPSSSLANEFIMPGQAFFVRNDESSVTSPAITFEEADKATVETQTAIFSTSSLAYLNMRLYTEEAWNNNQPEQDVLGIRWSANYTTAASNEDIQKLGNPDENFAINNNSTLIGIDKRSYPTETESIPLFINNYTTNNYVFYSQFANLPEHAKLYLVDNYLGTTTELQATDEYAFSVDTSILESVTSNRFHIVFDNTTLGVDENSLKDNFSLYPNPTKNGKFSIKVPNLTGEVEVEVVTLFGQQILSQKSVLEGQEIPMNVEGLTTGIYLVKLTQGETSLVSKLIVK